MSPDTNEASHNDPETNEANRSPERPATVSHDGPPGLWGKRDAEVGPPGLMGRKRSSPTNENISPIIGIMDVLKKIQKCQKTGICSL